MNLIHSALYQNEYSKLLSNPTTEMVKCLSFIDEYTEYFINLPSGFLTRNQIKLAGKTRSK